MARAAGRMSEIPLKILPTENESAAYLGGRQLTACDELPHTVGRDAEAVGGLRRADQLAFCLSHGTFACTRATLLPRSDGPVVRSPSAREVDFGHMSDYVSSRKRGRWRTCAT
jgi:hypothetical protein